MAKGQGQRLFMWTRIKNSYVIVQSLEAANFLLTDRMQSTDSVLHKISTLVTYLLFDLSSSGRVRCISSIFYHLQILGSNNDIQVMLK